MNRWEQGHGFWSWSVIFLAFSLILGGCVIPGGEGREEEAITILTEDGESPSDVNAPHPQGAERDEEEETQDLQLKSIVEGGKGVVNLAYLEEMHPLQSKLQSLEQKLANYEEAIEQSGHELQYIEEEADRHYQNVEEAIAREMEAISRHYQSLIEEREKDLEAELQAFEKEAWEDTQTYLQDRRQAFLEAMEKAIEEHREELAEDFSDFTQKLEAEYYLPITNLRLQQTIAKTADRKAEIQDTIDALTQEKQEIIQDREETMEKALKDFVAQEEKKVQEGLHSLQKEQERDMEQRLENRRQQAEEELRAFITQKELAMEEEMIKGREEMEQAGEEQFHKMEEALLKEVDEHLRILYQKRKKTLDEIREIELLIESSIENAVDIVRQKYDLEIMYTRLEDHGAGPDITEIVAEHLEVGG